MEEVVFGPDGEVRNPNLADYRMPTAVDMPPIEAHVVESDEPNGPFGAKGVGEDPIIAIGPAIANAIFAEIDLAGLSGVAARIRRAPTSNGEEDVVRVRGALGPVVTPFFAPEAGGAFPVVDDSGDSLERCVVEPIGLDEQDRHLGMGFDLGDLVGGEDVPALGAVVEVEDGGEDRDAFLQGLQCGRLVEAGDEFGGGPGGEDCAASRSASISDSRRGAVKRDSAR